MWIDAMAMLYWWAVLLVLGFLFLPLSKKLFGHLADGGYIFSKVLALAILGYVSWVLAALKILPFTQWGILLLIGISVAILAWKKFDFMTTYFVEKRRYVIAEEILFLTIMLFFAFLRGLNPEANNLEKFMDLGFVNSAFRAKFMPPPDMWYAGKTINYYYFGHFVTAFLAKLSGLDTARVFNMMLATIAGLGFGMAGSIAMNLYNFAQKKIKPAIGVGILTGLLFIFSSNLHTVIYGVILPALKRLGLYAGNVGQYWYADATRYIGYNPPTNDKTIAEFPSYSFVVADLHGHVLDMLFALLIGGLMLAVYFKKTDKKRRFVSVELVVLSLALSSAAMTNLWDLPIYFGLSGLVLLLKYLQTEKIGQAMKRASLECAKLAVICGGLISPFLWRFQNISQGVRFVENHSRFYQLLVLWGLPVVIAVALLGVLIWKKKVKLKTQENRADMFALMVALWALILIVLPETIYLRDIYHDGYARANTMFKLTFQAHILFTLSVGYISLRLLCELKKGWRRYSVGGLLLILIGTTLIFPFYSIPGFYNDLKLKNYQTLDGLNFLSGGDAKMVDWLDRNETGQPVILEAVGDSYSQYGRISMATGLPTVEGWLVHEWLWRGNYQEPAARGEEVKSIYESKDVNQTKNLITKYNVKYIIIGEMEKGKYTNIQEKKLTTMGKIVFNSSGSKIIKI